MNKGFAFLLMALMPILGYSQEEKNITTPEWLWSLGRVSLLDASDELDLILYQVKHYDVDKNSSSNTVYTMNRNGDDKKIIYNEKEKIGNLTIAEQEKAIYFLKDGLLHKMNLDGSGIMKLGITKMNAFHMSPTGNHVAYIQDVKHHKTLLEEYPEYTSANAMMFDDLMYRHWDHWEDDMRSNLFIQSLEDGKLAAAPLNITNHPYDTPLMPFGGMEQITWSPDGTHILYTMKKLSGKAYAVSTNSDIYAYNIKTGKTTNLTGDNKGYDMEPTFSPDGKYLVYNSMETDGYESDKNRIMMKRWPDGNTVDITTGIDEACNHPTFSPDGKFIYFSSGVEATNQLMKYDVKKKTFSQLTKGIHNVNDFIVMKKYVITRKNTMTDVHEIYSVDKRGKFKQLTNVNEKQYANVDKANVKEKWVTTSDGKKMKVWYILPPDFDPNKKYPTLLYCQGGPQSAVSQFFSFRWNFQIMAAQGYVIVAPNRRGLPSFGTEWNRQISKDWGGQAMKDYLSAIDDAIANEPYVDKDRVGAIGASYGGYSVYWLAGNHDGRFKTFISHCGLFNLESWYGTTEELFFANYDIGGPYWNQDLKKDYEKFSPHRYAANWDTPILVIHGGKDFRVPESEGMQAFQLAQLKGLKSKFLYFPDEGHWILSPQNGLIWHKEFFKWLDETLKNI